MMKKFLLFAMIFAAVAVAFTSCGDDNDEPAPPIKGVYSTLSGGATNYETTTEKYYEFKLTETTQPNYLYIYNVKFDPRMPISITMRIPLAGVQIKHSTDGFVYTIDHADTITPDLFRGATWTPYAEREITNFKLNTDLKNKTFSVSFDCMGMTFSDSGNLYIKS